MRAPWPKAFRGRRTTRNVKILAEYRGDVVKLARSIRHELNNPLVIEGMSIKPVELVK